jgi:AcrR family transcriptional regulator
MRTKEATRTRLFDAALDLFARNGYQATSHADIAFEADIARTTFYEYFTSTEDLLVQLVEARLPAMVAEMVDPIPADLGPDERLAALTARMIEFVGTDHLGLILHTEVPRLTDEAQRRIAAAHGNLSGAFGDIYRSGVEAGCFRLMPPLLAGRLIHEVIMTAGRTVMDAREPKQAVHDITDASVVFLLAGLSTAR